MTCSATLLSAALMAMLQLQPFMPTKLHSEMGRLLSCAFIEGQEDAMYLTIAIAMQESSLLGREYGPKDLGMFQIHQATAEYYELDVSRLRDLEDLEYQMEAHLFILGVKINECAGLGREAWTCYHSRTYSFRCAYRDAVHAHYKKINKWGATIIEEDSRCLRG